MSEPKPGVHIDVNQIPELSDRVPLVQTSVIAEAPGEFVDAHTRNLARHAERRDLGDDGAFGVYEGDRLIGYANPTTGESHIVPLLDRLQGNGSLRGVAAAGARRLLREHPHLFGGATEEIELSPPTQLMASHITRRGTRTEPAAMLGTVKITRRVEGLAVYGPGSHASATYSHQGLEAFQHRWTAAGATAERMEAHPRSAIRERIIEDIGELPERQAVHVRDVAPAYYDDGAGHLQPVYRYRVVKPSPDGVTAPAMYVGYVPIGERVAELPRLNPKVKTTPKQARPVGGLPPDDHIRIGRYVVRQDDSGWVASANSFWDRMSAWMPFIPQIPFTNAQYFWAEPRLFLAEKDSFINSVHLALTEVHGNWGLFSTLKNNADFVRLADIPTGGYGGDSAAGRLAYWILHSCEVIPTSTDETTSYDVWWRIFNGLHAAMGYRTEMYINDQATTDFGTLVALGAPVVSSWLAAVINDSNYHSGQNYTDDNRQMMEPMGRPSAIAVTGHGDDTVRMVTPLPKPKSLTEWWYDN